jgi:lysophospholipase L1-like esterase
VWRHESLGLAYHPDIAVYGFTINDIEGPHYIKSVNAKHRPVGLENSPFALWRVVGHGYVALRERWLPPVGTYAYELAQNYFDNPAAWADFTAVLHPFVQIYNKVAAAGRERGFLVIPSLPAFLGRKDKDLWVSASDPHPNAEGHRILAETLVAGLAALPETCWETGDRPPSP